MKPEYRIEKWSVVTYGARKHLMGHIQNHPNCTTGKLHLTSPIVQWISDDVVETRNSIYRLGEVEKWYSQLKGIMERVKN